MCPSTTLEVTLTTTPEPRSRNWGSTACVVAITPKVLVSKTSRTRAIDVPSNTPMDGTPALLTRTSMGPAASMAAAMLSGRVTSRATTRNRSDSGRRPGRGVRMVAMTFHPCAWKWRAVCCP